MKFDMQVGLGAGHIVLDGDPASPPKKGGGAPKFLAHVYYGQTAGWIKIILRTEVGLSSGDLVVLDGDPAPSPRRGRAPPQFSAHVYCGQTAAWIKMPLVQS